MAMSQTIDTQQAHRRLIRQSMNAPLLSRQHELDLARRWRSQRDERALHELTTAYMRLVISTASRFKNYGLPMADLVQEGVVGLMQAAARFEPERDVRFSTYAAWWIRSAMQDFILRNWSVVRTGTTAAQKSLFFNLRRLRARVGDQLVLISVGGIETAEDAWQRITAGAALLQGYTGFVYGGGLWAKGIHDGIAARLHAGGFASLTEAVGSAG